MCAVYGAKYITTAVQVEDNLARFATERLNPKAGKIIDGLPFDIYFFWRGRCLRGSGVDHLTELDVVGIAKHPVFDQPENYFEGRGLEAHLTWPMYRGWDLACQHNLVAIVTRDIRMMRCAAD